MSPTSVTTAGLERLRTLYTFPSQKPAVAELVGGWNSQENLDMFQQLVPRDASVVVELGTFLGQSVFEFLRLAPNATIICVDHWLGSEEHLEWVADRESLYQTFIANLWQHQERVIPLRSCTVEGMLQLWHLGIRPDFIYVDASHEYPAVLTDINLAIRLFPEAILCGDDFNWDGVQKAVEEVISMFQMKTRFRNNGRCWWIEQI